MARGIYEIKLKERFILAHSGADAVSAHCELMSTELNEEDTEVSLVCSEEDTMKLFMLAKTMYELDKFKFMEIKAALMAVAIELGYHADITHITDCILTWVERLDESSLTEIEDWLIG